MQQRDDGSFIEISKDEAERIRRIFAAGNQEVPVFSVGDEITVRRGHFKVLAFGGRLLVLEGVPFPGSTNDDRADGTQ